jgi:hypothetical protein
MPDDYSAAISGLANNIANIAGVALSASSNKHQQKRAIEHNWEMAKWQNATNIENWNMQNEYNSPVAQMQRLKEAGLNPNLVYDKGATTTASSLPSAPSPGQYPRIDYSQYAQMLNNQILDNAMKVAGIEKTAQETSNLSTYQRNLRLDGDMKELNIIAQNYANAKSGEEAKIWRDILNAKLRVLDSTDALNIRRNEKLATDIDYTNHALIPLANSNINNLDARKRLTEAELLLMPVKANMLQSQITMNLANAGVAYKKAELAAREIVKVANDTVLQKQEWKRRDQENTIRQILLDTGIDLNNRGTIGAAHSIGYVLGGWVNSAKEWYNETFK